MIIIFFRDYTILVSIVSLGILGGFVVLRVIPREKQCLK